MKTMAMTGAFATMAAAIMWGCASIVGIPSTLEPPDGGTGSSGGGSSGSGSGTASSSGGSGNSSGTASSSGGGSGGSSSGSSSGGPSAFVGTWSGTLTTSGSCAATSSASVSQSFTAGPGPLQITLPFGGTCNLTMTVTGETARLDPNQTCTGTSTTTGDTLLLSFSSGLMALTAPSTADFTLSATVTNESIGTTCSQNESATVTK